MNLYKCFFRSNTREVKAETSLEARDKAAVLWKAKHAYDVTAVLMVKDIDTNPKQVIHSTGAL